MNSSELADMMQVDHDGAINDTEDVDNSTQYSDFISLLDESFDVLDAGRGKRKDQTKINPEKMCLHCGWTARGSRQVFVNHILGLSSTAGRLICDGVPDDIKAKFQQAKIISSSKAVRNQIVCNSDIQEPENIIPVVADEILGAYEKN